MFYDPYFILIIPAIILIIYAQAKVHSTFNKYAKVPNKKGITGKEIAEMILKYEGITHVPVKETAGLLADHYNPIKKELRLSPNVYHSNSISAVGVAAHEVGHAIQHARSYYPLHLRTAIYPVVNFANYLAPILILISFFIQSFGLLKIGIIFYALSVAFTVITLPVEFDASARALKYLETHSVLDKHELIGSRKVLSAAALTYVAAAIYAILELLRLILISRRSD